MTLFVLVCALCTAVAKSAPPDKSGTRQTIVRPDPQLARIRADGPDQREMNKIERLVGSGGQSVLRRLGHPNIIKTKDGPINLPEDVSEIWQYQCKNGQAIWVEFHNGIVKKTYLQWCSGQMGLGNFMFLGQFEFEIPEK
jgi:hypothetical protein